MTKVKPTTKEQLVYYLLQNISLGTYDRRFLANLQTILARDKKPATTNQSELLGKITIRYAKQLRRQEIDANDMTKLPWNVEPIDSIPEYTDAFITINDDVIELRTPYKKDFISDIRSRELAIVWHKEIKIWTAPFCEDVLRHFIKFVEKHYHIVHYCNKTKEIINILAEYESASCWDPTLVNVNGNYMIAGITSQLDDAIKDITINSELATLSRLICYGVTISSDITNQLITDAGDQDEAKQLVNFVTSLSPVVDCTDTQRIVGFFKKVECDYIAIAESFGSHAKDLPVLISAIKDSGIPYLYIDKRSDAADLNFSEYKMPILINTGLWATPNQNKLRMGAAKTVFLGNNKPVKIN